LMSPSQDFSAEVAEIKARDARKKPRRPSRNLRVLRVRPCSGRITQAWLPVLDRVCGVQARNIVRRKFPVLEYRFGFWSAWRPLHVRLRNAETRRRRRLGHAIDIDKNLSRHIVRMARRLG